MWQREALSVETRSLSHRTRERLADIALTKQLRNLQAHRTACEQHDSLIGVVGRPSVAICISHGTKPRQRLVPRRDRYVIANGPCDRECFIAPSNSSCGCWLECGRDLIKELGVTHESLKTMSESGRNIERSTVERRQAPPPATGHTSGIQAADRQLHCRQRQQCNALSSSLHTARPDNAFRESCHAAC